MIGCRSGGSCSHISLRHLCRRRNRVQCVVHSTDTRWPTTCSYHVTSTQGKTRMITQSVERRRRHQWCESTGCKCRDSASFFAWHGPDLPQSMPIERAHWVGDLGFCSDITGVTQAHFATMRSVETGSPLMDFRRPS
jgi:hypothetical protein